MSNTLQDPSYTAMVNEVARSFPTIPLYSHTLDKIQNQAPTNDDMNVIFQICTRDYYLGRDNNLFRPLVGRVANRITTPDELKYTTLLAILLCRVDNSTDEIKPHHIEAFYKLIDGTHGTLTQEQACLFDTLQVILALESNKAHTTHLIGLGIISKILPFMEKTRNDDYMSIISPISTLILSNSSKEIRQLAYQTDLMSSVIKNPKNGIKMLALLSHHPEEISPENRTRFLNIAKIDYSSSNPVALGSKFIIQCNLLKPAEHRDFDKDILSFRDYFYNLIIDAINAHTQIETYDSSKAKRNVYRQEISTLLLFFRKLLLRNESIKHLFNLKIIYSLIEYKNYRLPLSIQDSILISGILHAFAQLPEEEIKEESELKFYRKHLYPVYKNIYQRFKAFQVANYIQSQHRLPPIALRLVGLYDHQLNEEKND